MTEIDQLRQGGTRLVECIEHPNGPHEWVCLTCVESSEEELEASLAEKDETICDERIGRKSAEARCEALAGDSNELRLIVARVGDRGVTDASTPTFIRVENIIEQLDKANARCEALEGQLVKLADNHAKERQASFASVDAITAERDAPCSRPR
jgi:hypothetical protein